MFSFAVLTISDSGFAGQREDLSGQQAIELARAQGYRLERYAVVPDEQAIVEKELVALCDSGNVALVLTTGGTGFAPRDVTPEATIAVVEKICPGIAEAMRAHSLQFTPRAMLSRATAGIRKKTLIVNLPGSPKAVQECLDCILPSLEHGLAILTQQVANCARQG